MVATARADVSASHGSVPTLRLNMLPVVSPDEIQKDVVYSLPYSDEVWEGTKERARGGKTFHSYRHGDRIYLWPHVDCVRVRVPHAAGHSFQPEPPTCRRVLLEPRIHGDLPGPHCRRADSR